MSSEATFSRPLLFALAMTASAFCQAEQIKPVWEVGIALGALSLPDYRGADERTAYLLPVPYFVYRGEFIKADRSGLQGTFFKNERLQVDLSVNATLAVNSENSLTRRGMADLDPIVELGPTADFKVWQAGNDKAKLDFRLPLRAAMTLDWSPRYVGLRFLPGVQFTLDDPPGWVGGSLKLQAAAIFSNRQYNNYLYGVPTTDAAPGRPAYQAASGYGGAQLNLLLSKRYPHYWVGGFLRFDSLAGAAFSDSPLVRKMNGVSAGLAISWIVSESSRKVLADE